MTRSGRPVAQRGEITRAILASGVVLAAGVGAAFANPPELLRPSGVRLPASSTPEVRSRAVHPAMDALVRTPVGGEVTLNLFDDCSLAALVDAVHLEHGYWVFTGRVSGEPDSSILFVSGATTLTGEVRSPKHGSFEVRCTPWRTHVVRQIDDTGFRPCGAGAQHEAACDHEPAHAVPAPRGGVPDIRVAVFHTPLARDDEGGEEAIRGRAVFAVNQANQAYALSGAVANLTLAHTGVVEYTETGAAGTELSRLRSTTDSHMDIVHCVRDIVQADAVALLVNDFDACGIAYIQITPGPGFATSAFSVTDKDCISNFTFAHEVGHNMGCAHDAANAGAAAFPYAYGYRTPDSVFRTIMAYAPGTRVQRFSSPNVVYQGYVMGVAGASNNASCITNTAFGISQFRSGAEGRYPDFNADGVVTSQDFFDFLTAFFSASPASDFNADGARNSQDFFDFIAAFFAAAC